jgi:hypothetical protein
MRQADRSVSVGAVLALVFGIAATGLLGSTLVLGLLGATSAVMWTGTTGCIFLAGWLLAANGRTTRRGKRS